MKYSLIILISTLLLFSCNNAKESAQDTINGAMEKVIENRTGTKVDLPDADDIENNAAYITYKSEVKNYLDGKEKMQASVIFQKDGEGLSIVLQGVAEGGKSFMATMSHIPDSFSLPLKGKFAVSNRYDGVNPSAVIMFMNVTENGMMTSEVPYEGELTISKLSKSGIEFQINGKGGDPSDAESPTNWKTMSGSGKISSPIIMSYGIDKNNVLK